MIKYAVEFAGNMCQGILFTELDDALTTYYKTPKTYCEVSRAIKKVTFCIDGEGVVEAVIDPKPIMRKEWS